MKCDICGFDSTNEKLFKNQKEPFARSKTRCFSCQRSKELTLQKFMFWIPLLPGAYGLYLALTQPVANGAGLLMDIGFVALAGLGATVFHELGHLIAAKLTGHHVYSIQVGLGSLVCDSRLFGIRWRLRAVPVGGQVVAALPDSRWFGLRSTVFILGGVAMNAVCFLVAWKFIHLDKRLEDTSFAGFMPMIILFYINAATIFLNLLPRRSGALQGFLATDGLRLWRIWKHPAETIVEAKVSSYSLQAEDCRLEWRFKESDEWLERGLREFHLHPQLRFALATNPVFAGDFEAAHAALTNLREPLANNKVLFPLLLNNIAYVDALLGSPDLLAEADECSTKALELAGANIIFKGTRGLVLIQLDRFDEGVPLLQEAFRKHPEKWGKAINACCLGLAAARQGRLDDCRRLVALARK